YRLSSSEIRFRCAQVDDQIGGHLSCIQVDSDQIPEIRRVYQQDVTKYIGQRGQEAQVLQQALERVKGREIKLWRGYTQLGMNDDIYVRLAQEAQAERERIENALQSLKQESGSHIEDLDIALAILSEIGTRYQQLCPKQQREILKQLVSKVIIDMSGKIETLELLPPFTYLNAISEGENLIE
ncbi:MAG: hypothetical protein KC615_26220, partial [Anaerolineae bacterium]|nr:hypothetical protein [Anaerolineae bacterium]